MTTRALAICSPLLVTLALLMPGPLAADGGQGWVVTLECAVPGGLNYKYRWKGEQKWNDARLAFGERRNHTRPLGGPGGPPVLEIIRGNAARENSLPARSWDGSKPEAAKSYYRIRR